MLAGIHAFEDARASGDMQQLAQVALSLPSTLGFGPHPGQVPALVHEAYLAVTDPVLRCRLAAALARAWVYGGDPHRAEPFAVEAVALADRVTDREVVAEALDAALLSRWGPDDFTERLRLSARLADTTAHLIGVEPRLSALLWRLTTAWECLDLLAVQRQLRALDMLAGESGSTRVAFFAAARRAMYALVVEPVDEADRLIALTRRLGAEAAEADLEAVVHSLAASRASRVHDTEALLAEAAAFEAFGTQQAIPSIVAEAAALWLEGGSPERATRLLHRLVGSGLAGVPRDVDFLLTVTSLVDVAAAGGMRELAQQGTVLLEPYAGRAVLNAGAVAFHGVVDDYLTRAYRLVDPTNVRRWRESAAVCYLRIGADCWLERLQGPSAVPGVAKRPLVVHLHQQADGRWTVGRDGETVELPDLRGLHYLQHLLRRPGSEVTSTELAAAVDGHPGQQVIESGAGDLLDTRALVAYRQRLVDIDRELADADSRADQARSEGLSSEREALLAQLRAASGLDGRARRFTSGHERARVAVRKAIAATLHRIDQHDPPLARQLRDTVHTGALCHYLPDPSRPVTWRLDAAPEHVAPRSQGR